MLAILYHKCTIHISYMLFPQFYKQIHGGDLFFAGLIGFILGTAVGGIGISLATTLIAILFLITFYLLFFREISEPIHDLTVQEVSNKASRLGLVDTNDQISAANHKNIVSVSRYAFSIFKIFARNLNVCVRHEIVERLLNPLLFILTLTTLFIGNIYYTVDDYTYYAKQATIEDETLFEGKILTPPISRIKGQKATITLKENGGKIFLHINSYPIISYGDTIRIEGKLVLPPSDSYGRYMAKEKVIGTIFWPSEIEVIGNEKNFFMSGIFSIRENFLNTLNRLFSSTQSAFLSGVLLGDRTAFSDEFIDKLSASGTMHLTALSGLHMAIIVFGLFYILAFLFPNKRGVQIIFTFTIVALFVAMTGFKVSAIRASLMAFLVQLALYYGRIYSPRNAILLVAFFIVLSNPKSVIFDLGFQLSFLAVISIIYFSPVLMQLKFFAKESFLNWRTILAITIAAQIGVFPITAYNFANFSFSSLPANIAILVIMPPLMWLGFMTAIFGSFSSLLGTLFAIPTAFLTDYSMFMIDIFAKIQIPFNPTFTIFGGVIYYAILAWICWRWGKQ